MVDIDAAVEMILAGRRRVPAHESMLVAVSGIDGSGKGYVTERIIACIQRKSLHAVTANVDGWLNFPSLNFPSRRFHKERPEEHFYRHAIRFDDMFEQLILPLKRQRSIRVEADLAEETATVYHRHVYDFRDVDVIVLEGIYLLKRAFRRYYNLALWVNCSFETALIRALRREQEGLSPNETIEAYQTLYFPAQYIHFALDDPRSTADAILDNDH
jgi:uridine kinase